MKVAISKFILFKIFKWKIIGEFPEDISKYVIIGAPHTSNYDFIIGLLVKTIRGVKTNFLGKASLFIFPIGYFFRSVGGVPIDRKKNMNMVEATVSEFNSRSEFIIAISPEGTRSKVYRWKTGFYHIANQAKVPVVPLTFDFGRKQTEIFPPFYTTGDIEKDIEFLKLYYNGIEGKVAQNG